MKKKQIISILMTVLMLALMLTACGSAAGTSTSTEGNISTGDNTSADEVTDEHESVILQVQMSASEWQSGWDQMKEKFETEYPWITLEDVGDGQTQIEFISSCIASGDIPSVIQVIRNEVYLGLVQEGLLMDLKEFDAIANTPQYYVDFYTEGDTVYGVAQGTAFSVLYINMKALKEAGWEAPPTNWEEFSQCCQDILDKTDYSPIVVDAQEPTLCYMPLELLVASSFSTAEEGAEYEEGVKNGTFDYSAFPGTTEKLEQFVTYMMPGSSQTGMDDVPSVMADGTAAMYLGGNWVSTSILTAIAENAGSSEDAIAVLPPFGDSADEKWISASPETGYGIVIQEDENLNEAAKIFIEWLYTPENFKFMQNVKGTVPVLTNMSEDLIVLEPGIKEIVSEVGKTKAVLMGFNLLSEVANESTTIALQDAYSGNAEVSKALETITNSVQNNPVQ